MAPRFLLLIGVVLFCIRFSAAGCDWTDEVSKGADSLTKDVFVANIKAAAAVTEPASECTGLIAGLSDPDDGLKIAFNLMDEDDSGGITKEEFLTFPVIIAQLKEADVATLTYAAVDLDGIGGITIDELFIYLTEKASTAKPICSDLYDEALPVLRKVRKIYNEVDGDGDHSISAEEFAFFGKTYKYLATGHWDGTGGDFDPNNAADIWLESGPVKIKEVYSINKEGFLKVVGSGGTCFKSLDERAVKIAFNLIDKDNDNQVTAAEFTAVYKGGMRGLKIIAAVSEIKSTTTDAIDYNLIDLDDPQNGIDIAELKEYFTKNEKTMNVDGKYPLLYQDKIVVDTRLKSLFDEIDADGGGSLDKQEWKFFQTAYDVVGTNDNFSAHESYYDLMVDYYFELELEQAREEQAYRKLNDQRKMADDQKQYEANQRLQRQQLRSARARSPNHHRFQRRQYQRN